MNNDTIILIILFFIASFLIFGVYIFPIIGRRRIYKKIAEEFKLDWIYEYKHYLTADISFLSFKTFVGKMGGTSGVVNGHNIEIYDVLTLPLLSFGSALGASKKTVFEKDGRIDKEISHFGRQYYASEKEIRNWIKIIN